MLCVLGSVHAVGWCERAFRLSWYIMCISRVCELRRRMRSYSLEGVMNNINKKKLNKHFMLQKKNKASIFLPLCRDMFLGR